MMINDDMAEEWAVDIYAAIVSWLWKRTYKIYPRDQNMRATSCHGIGQVAKSLFKSTMISRTSKKACIFRRRIGSSQHIDAW